MSLMRSKVWAPWSLIFPLQKKETKSPERWAQLANPLKQLDDSMAMCQTQKLMTRVRASKHCKRQILLTGVSTFNEHFPLESGSFEIVSIDRDVDNRRGLCSYSGDRHEHKVLHRHTCERHYRSPTFCAFISYCDKRSWGNLAKDKMWT